MDGPRDDYSLAECSPDSLVVQSYVANESRAVTCPTLEIIQCLGIKRKALFRPSENLLLTVDLSDRRSVYILVSKSGAGARARWKQFLFFTRPARAFFYVHYGRRSLANSVIPRGKLRPYTPTPPRNGYGDCCLRYPKLFQLLYYRRLPLLLLTVPRNLCGIRLFTPIIIANFGCGAIQTARVDRYLHPLERLLRIVIIRACGSLSIIGSSIEY